MSKRKGSGRKRSGNPAVRSRVVEVVGSTPVDLGWDGVDPVERAAADLRRSEQDFLDALDHARDLGRTWADIGNALGMTRQGAQQRYARLRKNATTR